MLTGSVILLSVAHSGLESQTFYYEDWREALLYARFLKQKGASPLGRTGSGYICISASLPKSISRGPLLAAFKHRYGVDLGIRREGRLLPSHPPMMWPLATGTTSRDLLLKMREFPAAFRLAMKHKAQLGRFLDGSVNRLEVVSRPWIDSKLKSGTYVRVTLSRKDKTSISFEKPEETSIGW